MSGVQSPSRASNPDSTLSGRRLTSGINSALIGGGNPEAVMQMIEKKLAKETKKLHKYHQVDIKNLKSVVMKEYQDVVRVNAAKTANMLTKEHRSVIKQFVNFKERTIKHLS